MTEKEAVKIIEELIDGYLDTYYSIMKNENECYKDFAMEFLEYAQALKLILGNYAEVLYKIIQIEEKENKIYTKESEDKLLIAGYIQGLLSWYKGDEKANDTTANI